MTNLKTSVALLCAHLIDTSGQQLASPIHNSFIGDAAGFFLLTHIYALSIDKKATYNEEDGFDGTTAWLITIGDDEFNWNLTSHPGHVTRNGQDLYFSQQELDKMLTISDEELQLYIKDLSFNIQTGGSLAPWLRVTGLLADNNSIIHVPISSSSITTPAEFFVFTALTNTSETLVEFSVKPALEDAFINYGLEALSNANKDFLTWNQYVHPSYTSRNGSDLTFSQSEISELVNSYQNHQAVLVAAMIEDIHGDQQVSPAHNSYIGDSAGFFLVTHIYA